MRVYLARVRIDLDVMGWDGTGDDEGPVPPGSNIQGMTAQLEQP